MQFKFVRLSVKLGITFGSGRFDREVDKSLNFAVNIFLEVLS